MKKKDFYKTLPLIILVLAIGLSPRFSFGTIASGKSLDLRIEDFLLFILGFFWLGEFLMAEKKKFQKPPLFSVIMAWLGMGLFSVLANLIFMNLLVSRSFFYFLKEIEYFFLFFYVFYHIKTIDSAKLLLKIWIFVGFINVAWIIFELISGFKITYYYGPTPLMEPKGTFPAGGFFLIVFIFLLNVLLYYYSYLKITKHQKIILFVLVISPAIGVLSSGSRGSFIGLVFATFISFFLYSLSRKVFLKSFLILFLMIFFISGVFLFSKSPVLDRFFNVSEIKGNLNPENPLSRPGIWLQQIREMAKNPFFLFFGYGKAVILGGIGESHSQYIRNFVETGIIGSFLFFLLLYLIIKKSVKGFLFNKERFLASVSAGLFCCTAAMMVISLFAEGFIVVKINEAYWFFAALTFAVLYINKNSDDAGLPIS